MAPSICPPHHIPTPLLPLPSAVQRCRLRGSLPPPVDGALTAVRAQGRVSVLGLCQTERPQHPLIRLDGQPGAFGARTILPQPDRPQKPLELRTEAPRDC